MSYRFVAAIVVVATVAWNAGSGFAADSGDFEYVVVAHSSVTETQMTSKQLSEMFLKERSIWDNGVLAKPIDLSADSPVRERFSHAVHGRSAANIKAHWMQQVFRGQLSPPVEVEDEQEAIELVRKLPGAVAYVSRRVAIDDLAVIDIIFPPRQIHKVAPRYPAAARRARVQGDVVVRVTVGTEGTVDEVQVLYGLPYGLSEAAVLAVRQWRFAPATTSTGQAVVSTIDLEVHFYLN